MRAIFHSPQFKKKERTKERKRLKEEIREKAYSFNLILRNNSNPISVDQEITILEGPRFSPTQNKPTLTSNQTKSTKFNHNTTTCSGKFTLYEYKKKRWEIEEEEKDKYKNLERATSSGGGRDSLRLGAKFPFFIPSLSESLSLSLPLFYCGFLFASRGNRITNHFSTNAAKK